MQICFVSNYINHHQIPFCNAMCKQEGVEFTFIQTEPMAEERVKMGWKDTDLPTYVRLYYEEKEQCQKLIDYCDVLLFGGCDDESYVQERLRSGKLILRLSERLYKTGQWKAISPRGLRKKYLDHTRYGKRPVYLLCCGGYVASDFHIVRAYPGKMFCWGYFPEMHTYDVESLLKKKGYVKKSIPVKNADETNFEKAGLSEEGEKIPYLLWAARFIDWKHPELALQTAKYLKDQGLTFQLDIIGGGQMEEEVKQLIAEYGLESCVRLLGYQKPEDVRGYMEQADIYLFTSDRQEGWGAVANEAMNSGCAVIANHMIGAAPYLIQNGKNGLLYRDGDVNALFEGAKKLVEDVAFRKNLGRAAYDTITTTWNAEHAAEKLMIFIREVAMAGKTAADRSVKTGEAAMYEPCMPAPVIRESGSFRFLTRKQK